MGFAAGLLPFFLEPYTRRPRPRRVSHMVPPACCCLGEVLPATLSGDNASPIYPTRFQFLGDAKPMFGLGAAECCEEEGEE